MELVDLCVCSADRQREKAELRAPLSDEKKKKKRENIQTGAASGALLTSRISSATATSPALVALARLVVCACYCIIVPHVI